MFIALIDIRSRIIAKKVVFSFTVFQIQSKRKDILGHCLNTFFIVYNPITVYKQ